MNAHTHYLMKFCAAFVCAFFWFAGPPVARGQEQAAPASSATAPAAAASSESAALEALAVKMAEAITKSKQKSVIVLDFANADGKVTPLGQELADEFNAALINTATNLTVHPRDQMPACRSNLFYYGDSDVGLQAARDLNVKVVIFGRVASEPSEVSLSIEAYRVDRFKGLGAFRVRLPLTDNLKVLADAASRKGSVTSVAKSGEAGYGFPTCLECPRAEFAVEALKHNVRGVVVVLAVVGVDGRACDITVEKKLGYGLDEKAIEAILKWKFKPATGPDGSPAAVQVPIEIDFR